MEISNFYMIGDNPESDIKGANAAGWTSILVKTGIFNPKDEKTSTVDGNDVENPATHVVADFEEAVNKIFEIEKLEQIDLKEIVWY